MKERFGKEFKKHQEETAFCPKCNTLMKRTVEKRGFLDKLFGNLPMDGYDCPKCGAGTF